MAQTDKTSHAVGFGYTVGHFLSTAFGYVIYRKGATVRQVCSPNRSIIRHFCSFYIVKQAWRPRLFHVQCIKEVRSALFTYSRFQDRSIRSYPDLRLLNFLNKAARLTTGCNANQITLIQNKIKPSTLRSSWLVTGTKKQQIVAAFESPCPPYRTFNTAMLGGSAYCVYVMVKKSKNIVQWRAAEAANLCSLLVRLTAGLYDSYCLVPLQVPVLLLTFLCPTRFPLARFCRGIGVWFPATSDFSRQKVRQTVCKVYLQAFRLAL